MRIEILGSGGSIVTPRPGCFCAICEMARSRGVPYSRSGPSIFIHEPELLFDTPEEIGLQLNRARIRQVRTCFYSHWHPDHVMGRRVWEMNEDWKNWPPTNRVTDIYLPAQVAVDFRDSLGSWDHLLFLQSRGLISLIELSDGQVVRLGDYTVEPFRLRQEFVYAFVVSDGRSRVLVAPDELVGWEPPPALTDLDLAIMPMGVVEVNPVTGNRSTPHGHPILESEMTFERTVDLVRDLRPRRAVLTHIEEPDQVSVEELAILEKRLASQGLPVAFAYDTMMIEL